ncbi:unnamed protein product [Ostreobium quekettii]|uniref:Uncharacterized protein n=1 Tax=Ostreobium quekettii TaxID=121088 RepID=A0A8S1JAI2_9CHLO|nr:unnamed protein product [Ostreobium quekettii]
MADQDVSFNDTKYVSVCTQIPVASLFSGSGRDAYQPETKTYLEDVAEDKATAGLVMASICLLFALAMLIWSCVLCCIRPRVSDESELEKVRQAQSRTGKCAAFMLVTLVIAHTLVVIGMAAWGIYETEDKVNVVVTRSFRLVNSTENELDQIHQNLSTVIDKTESVVTQLEQLASTSTVELVSPDTIELASDALKLAKDVRANNLEVYLDKAREVQGYEDEAGDAQKAFRAVLITSFVLMIVVASLVCLFVVCLASPWGTLAVMIFMWLLLFVIFSFGVGFGTMAREITEDTCLYMDEYAIARVENAVSADFRRRVEPLLKYYFLAPSAKNRSVEELQVLWDLPLEDFEEALDQAEEDLGAAIPQITDARGALAFVRTIIAGAAWRVLHADLVDLVCCTVYDAVDSIWIAYVTSAAASFILAAIGTIQVIKAVWMSRPPTVPAVPTTAKPYYSTGKGYSAGSKY